MLMPKKRKVWISIGQRRMRNDWGKFRLNGFIIGRQKLSVEAQINNE